MPQTVCRLAQPLTQAPFKNYYMIHQQLAQHRWSTSHVEGNEAAEGRGGMNLETADDLYFHCTNLNLRNRVMHCCSIDIDDVTRFAPST